MSPTARNSHNQEAPICAERNPSQIKTGQARLEPGADQVTQPKLFLVRVYQLYTWGAGGCPILSGYAEHNVSAR
jgi:hypothetical protein